jgi:hypothetical protein
MTLIQRSEEDNVRIPMGAIVHFEISLTFIPRAVRGSF